jgi:hypothetical protein
MPRMIYDYTKSVLERVSFDPILFFKRVEEGNKKSVAL